MILEYFMSLYLKCAAYIKYSLVLLGNIFDHGWVIFAILLCNIFFWQIIMKFDFSSQFFKFLKCQLLLIWLSFVSRLFTLFVCTGPFWKCWTNHDHHIIINHKLFSWNRWQILVACVTSMKYPDLFHEKMCTLKKAQQHDGT